MFLKHKMPNGHHHLANSSVQWIIAISILFCSSSMIMLVECSPAKLDSNETPFPLELQPPLLGESESAFDSYGNPIDTLKPIETPDGRKVISAQGVQFEIPTYASGITEIKKPADDLLPPHIGELNTEYNTASNYMPKDNVNVNDHDNDKTKADYDANVNQSDNDNVNDDDDDDDGKFGISNTHAHVVHTNNDAAVYDTQQQTTQTAQTTPQTNTQATTQIAQQPTKTTIVEATTTTKHATHIKAPLLEQPQNSEISPTSHHNAFEQTQSLNPAKKSSQYPQLTHYNSLRSIKSPLTRNSYAFPLNDIYPNPNPIPTTTTINSASNTAGVPLSSGNFNYPNIPQDIETINRIAAKYNNKQLSTIDPIVVSLSNDEVTITPTPEEQPQQQQEQQARSFGIATAADIGASTASQESTSVEVEKANLVHVKLQKQPLQTLNYAEQQPQYQQHQQHQAASDPLPQVVAAEQTTSIDGTLPDYILALNDPDISGPVPWTPSPNAGVLKVIAWDLLPPHADASATTNTEQAEPAIVTAENQKPKRILGEEDPVTHNIRVTLTTGNGLTQLGDVSSTDTAQLGQVSKVDLPTVNNEYGHGTNAHVGDGKTTTTNGRFPSRGNVHYSTSPTQSGAYRTTRPSTPQATTTTKPTTTTTTTTRRPTTTTTRRTTTTTTTTQRPTTTTTSVAPLTTTTPLSIDEIYKLENEEAYGYTLPPWLADVTDPDLDVAVTFIVPTDNDQYNHTLERDLEPPLEPFVDLNYVQLTPPTNEEISSTTTKPTTTTTTTKSTTTTRPTTTTTRRTTTTTATTTTTHRPTASTTRAYWVRATPSITPATSTTTFRYPSTINNRGAFNHLTQTPTPTTTQAQVETYHSNTQPQALTTPTPITTSEVLSTDAVLAQTQTNANVHEFNANTATATFTSAEDATANAGSSTTGNVAPVKHVNPFLPKPFTHQFASTTPTTTTTTTTTTPASVLAADEADTYENPFNSATIPPWLRDFDYADVGPGVPYDPNNFKDDESEHKSASPPQSSNPFQSPKGFSHQTSTTTTGSATPSSSSSSSSAAVPASASTSNSGIDSVSDSDSESSATSTTTTTTTSTTSAFPSKVTLALPSITQSNDDTPPLVLIPPMDVVEPANADSNVPNFKMLHSNNNKHNAIATPTSTHFNPQQHQTKTNKNFPAKLEPQIPPTQQPVNVNEARFPPTYQNNELDTAQKVEYTKSDDGKVITTPFVQAQRKDTFTNSVFNGFAASTASSFGSTTTTTTSTAGTISTTQNRASDRYTGSFGGPPGLLRPLVVNTDPTLNIYVAGDKHDYSKNVKKLSRTTAGPAMQMPYTGGFNAPPGVLSPTLNEPKPFQQNNNQNRAFNNGQPQLETAATSYSGQVYKNRFGGPPGIFVPYDNVKKQ